MKRALLTGLTGQDGRYLAELLHSKGYTVFGVISGQHNPAGEMVTRDLPFVEVIEGDLCDISSLIRAVDASQPDEIYNLGAISFVGMSFQQPELTANVTGLGVLRMLEAIRTVGGRSSAIRFYQASSSEMFGKVREVPQTEQTAFHPRSPYGVAKVFGHQMTVNYRESYDMFAVGGILFNHESPRRGVEFITRKVTHAVARIKAGLQNEILLGNMEARRDWGFAGDYVEAMWLMLQVDEPDDFVIATGESHTVQEMVELVFELAGIGDWERYVKQDPRFMRPAEVDLLIGDASKAEHKLGWKPKVGFKELMAMMLEHDEELVSRLT